MNWTMVLSGFSLAVLVGAGSASLLAQLRPQWSVRRRSLVAASVLPTVTLIATVAGLVWLSSLKHRGGGDMRDLALSAVVALGAGAVMLALMGGLAGAILAQLRKAR